MKRIVLLATMLLFVCCSCMTYTSLNTPKTKQFKKDIMSEFKQISSLQTRFSVPAFYFNFSLKKGATESDMFNIFYKTRELIQKEDFQKEFFEAYFKQYPPSENTEKVYPGVYVHFDLDSDGEAEFQFESLYYTKPYSSGRKNEIDKYKTWRYWDFKSESKPIPEQNTKSTQ